jgi:hypothetical protein
LKIFRSIQFNSMALNGRMALKDRTPEQIDRDRALRHNWKEAAPKIRERPPRKNLAIIIPQNIRTVKNKGGCEINDQSKSSAGRLACGTPEIDRRERRGGNRRAQPLFFSVFGLGGQNRAAPGASG